MARSVPPPPKGGRRIPAPVCEVPGCTESTRERKPFCTKHVAEHSYVQRLLAQLGDIDREIKATQTKGARAVDVNGPVAGDLIGFIRDNGARSVPRLARDLNLPVPVVKSYVSALTKAGRVVTSRTERGAVRVELKRVVACPTPGSFHQVRGRAG